MLPLLAIGTAIGAASSIVNAVSWVSHQLSDSKPANTPPQQPAAKHFAAALSAKTAEQKLPPATTGSAPSPANWLSSLSAAAPAPGPTDIQARVQASLSAYRQHGEHRAPAAAAA